MKKTFYIFLSFLLLLSICFCNFDNKHIAFADGQDESIIIAVIDSGINKSKFTNKNILDGYNYYDNNYDYSDDSGHGTNVAEIIFSEYENATIVPLKCFSGDKGCTAEVLARAIYDAVDVYHAKIINMSWTLKNDHNALYGAVTYAYGKNVALVASSGNVTGNIISGQRQGTLLYPAAYDCVIGVGGLEFDEKTNTYSVAKNSQQTKAVFTSSYWRTVDNAHSGTSYSAPRISAEIAKLYEKYPDMPITDVFATIKKYSVDLGAVGYDEKYGYGRFDASLIGENITSTVTFIVNGEIVDIETFNYGDNIVLPNTTSENHKIDWNFNPSRAGVDDIVILGELLCAHKYMEKHPDCNEFVNEGFNVQTISAETLVSPQTYTQKAIYNYSCSCGEISTEYTFEYGEKLVYTIDKEIVKNLTFKVVLPIVLAQIVVIIIAIY